jgi:hypothetical protein
VLRNRLEVDLIDRELRKTISHRRLLIFVLNYHCRAIISLPRNENTASVQPA